MTPDVLIVGHIAKDITDDGWRAGGSVLYAAVQCERLGLKVAAVTACEAGIEPEALAPSVLWHVVRDEETTTFANRQVEGRRRQHLLARARELGVSDVPAEWRAARLVLLMPIFHDVAPSLVQSFAGSASVLGASVQGWLRQLDITDIKPLRDTVDARLWQGIDVVFVSEEDVAEPESVAEWARTIPTVVLTRSKQGTTVWSEGLRTDLPALPAVEIDPTGAGDVFAAAFVARFDLVRDPIDAARFASAAAALSVQGWGTETIAGHEAIESRLRQGAA